MSQKYLYIKHNVNGPTYKIPVDEFTKDFTPGQPNELPAPAPVDHDEWYDLAHAFNEQNHFPETYKD